MFRMEEKNMFKILVSMFLNVLLMLSKKIVYSHENQDLHNFLIDFQLPFFAQSLPMVPIMNIS